MKQYTTPASTMEEVRRRTFPFILSEVTGQETDPAWKKFTREALLESNTIKEFLIAHQQHEKFLHSLALLSSSQHAVLTWLTDIIAIVEGKTEEQRYLLSEVVQPDNEKKGYCDLFLGTIEIGEVLDQSQQIWKNIPVPLFKPLYGGFGGRSTEDRIKQPYNDKHLSVRSRPVYPAGAFLPTYDREKIDHDIVYWRHFFEERGPANLYEVTIMIPSDYPLAIAKRVHGRLKRFPNAYILPSSLPEDVTGTNYYVLSTPAPYQDSDPSTIQCREYNRDL